MSQVFRVEKHWGFAETAVAGGDLTRGAPVTVSNGVATLAEPGTTADKVYLVDCARPEELVANETLESLEAVPSGAKCVVLGLQFGVFTLPARHFVAKPSVGDDLELAENGTFQSTTSGTVVARVIAVEGDSTNYLVTIRPLY